MAEPDWPTGMLLLMSLAAAHGDALVEAAPHDLARRFKNLHHKLSHHGL